MAVEPKLDLPPRIDRFYYHFRQYAVLTALAGQVTIGFLVVGMVWFLQRQLPIEILLVVVLGSFFLLELITTMLVITTILKPTQIFSSALVHISGEQAHAVAPNVNTSRYERSGLKALVQLIYSQAAHIGEEEAAQANSGIADQLLELAPVGIMALDGNGRIVYASEHAPVYHDQAGRPHIELLFDTHASLEEWIKSAKANKIADTRSWQRIPNRLPEADGRKIYDVVASYNRDANDEFDIILVTIDRSDTYLESEESLDFIALAAHELRGPITVIRGYLDVLRDELASSLSVDQHNLLDRLNVSAAHLSGYVNNILNVSRYDRRHLKLHLAESGLDKIYSTIQDDLALRAKTQNRLLSIRIPADLPTVAADQSSVAEVITNLVDNAIKYSREGGQIEVSAAVSGNFVSLSVTDHGIGIPSSVIGSLFTKFYRSHRSREAVAGTGLGLYLSRAIVESHGGSIEVKSQEGEGATFTFTLPIYKTVADKLASSDNENKGIIQTSHGWIKNHSLYRK